jgi:hypothetical protein
MRILYPKLPNVTADWFITPASYSGSIVYKVGFEVLTTESMQMAVFWFVAPCSLVEIYQGDDDDGDSKHL